MRRYTIVQWIRGPRSINFLSQRIRIGNATAQRCRTPMFRIPDSDHTNIMRILWTLKCRGRYGSATICFSSEKARDARAAELMYDGYTVVPGWQPV